jgi:hypothetical protein
MVIEIMAYTRVIDLGSVLSVGIIIIEEWYSLNPAIQMRPKRCINELSNTGFPLIQRTGHTLFSQFRGQGLVELNRGPGYVRLD